MDRQLKWDQYYLRVAAVVASASKDPSTQVGAVLVRPWRGVADLPGNRIVATGFNGFPEGMDDDPALYANREYKYKHIVHAEVAAIESLGDIRLDGYTLYTSFPCCEECVAYAEGRGIRRIVTTPINFVGKDPAWVSAWWGRLQDAARVAVQRGVSLETVGV